MSAVTAKLLLDWVMSANFGLLVLTLVLMARARSLAKTLSFAGFVGVSALQFAADLAVMYHRHSLGISIVAACNFLRYGSVAFEAVETVFLLYAIHGIFSDLMKPMVGLQKIGSLLFRWVGAVGVCLACVVILGPHLRNASTFSVLFGQFQEGVALLTLCLLLALVFAARPLGLSAGSRAFGMLVGLGVLSTTSLAASNWFGEAMMQSPYSGVHLIGGFGCMAAAITWSIYFMRPEQARRMITLPTTSEFFFWNRVAETLGDEPGRVAIAGFTPDRLAPAELLAFSSPVRQPAPVVEMPQVARR